MLKCFSPRLIRLGRKIVKLFLVSMEIKKVIDRNSFAVKITLEEVGQVMGWAFLYIMFQDRHVEPYGYLENVFVEPAYQKRGLGTQLINLAIAEAKERGCYKIIGTSKHHKIEIHQWYEKNGFKKYGYAFRLDLIEDTRTVTSDGKEEWTPLNT